MADEKAKPGLTFTPFEVFMVIVILLGLISYIGPAVWSYVSSGQISFYGFRLSGIYDFLRSYVWLFKILGFSLAGAAALGTFAWNKKRDAILAEEKSKVYPEQMAEPVLGELPKNPLTEKWKEIVQKSESENLSDWKVAIIEADIILSDLLNNLRLPGETMGDKLKAVEPSDFNTIEAAWEAHKFRNMIAHEGSNFAVNPREIRRIISLYESVFKEFSLI